MNYCFPEPGVYKFSDTMGKSITHLTCLAGLTVYTCNLTQNFEVFMQLEQLLDIHQTLVINCSNKICIQLKSIRSMYVKIACNKNQLIIAKNNVWFSIWWVKLLILLFTGDVKPHQRSKFYHTFLLYLFTTYMWQSNADCSVVSLRVL